MHLCQGFFPILILLFLTSILATDSSPTRWRRSKELRDSGAVTDEVIDVVEAEKLSRATTDKVKKVFDEKQRKARNKVQEVSDSILDKVSCLHERRKYQPKSRNRSEVVTLLLSSGTILKDYDSKYLPEIHT